MYIIHRHTYLDLVLYLLYYSATVYVLVVTPYFKYSKYLKWGISRIHIPWYRYPGTRYQVLASCGHFA